MAEPKKCPVCPAFGDGKHHNRQMHLAEQQRKQNELQFDPNEEHLRLVEVNDDIQESSDS